MKVSERVELEDWERWGSWDSRATEEKEGRARARQAVLAARAWEGERPSRVLGGLRKMLDSVGVIVVGCQYVGRRGREGGRKGGTYEMQGK